MSVKPVGIGSPVAAVSGVTSAESAQGVLGAQGAVGAQAAAVVKAAVQDVASRIRAGEVSRGVDALEAVIEQLVRAQAPAAMPAEALARRVEEMQLALAGQPVFAARVDGLLRDALAS